MNSTWHPDSESDACPTCGKPIDPFKKVWISYPENIFYHYECRPAKP